MCIDFTTLIDSMGKEPSLQSICGCNVLLPGNGYNYVLASKGDAGGNCFATLVIGQTSKLTCKICVILEELSLVADVMNMTFTGEAESVSLTLNKVVRNMNPKAHISF